MSNIIEFKSKRESLTSPVRKYTHTNINNHSVNKALTNSYAFQFSNYDISCISEALLYFNGVLSKNENQEESTNYDFLMKMYLKITIHEKDKLSSFIFNNDEIGLLANVLLHYSNFVSTQAVAAQEKAIEDNVDQSDDIKDIWAKKSYITKLYNSISEYYKS